MEEERNKRPIWNIAHMVNSISEVDSFLKNGANGIECDIQFDSKGNPVFTKHGFPCDFKRKWWMSEDIDVYLDKMRELTTPGHENFREKLVLLFLDLKVGKLTPKSLKYASKSLATKLIDIYWQREKSGAQAYFVLAVPSLEHIEFVGSFLEALKDDGEFYSNKIGFTFFGNEDIKKINSVLKSDVTTHRIWQGDGITNWAPRGYERLQKLLKKRKKGKSQFFNKVYWWTVDSMSTMRDILRLEVNAITTNYPENLTAVLKEFSGHLRLANIKDNPFEKYSGL